MSFMEKMSSLVQCVVTRKYGIHSLFSWRNRPLSRSRHFESETRLDGHKQCTHNKLCILKMACALFMPVQPRFKSKISGT